MEPSTHHTIRPSKLEGKSFLVKGIRFYNAGSSECFGDTKNKPADEKTPFQPRSPYAVAKCAAHWQVSNYREAYNLFACTGLLFNHESCLRPARFVTQKIVQCARRIANGSNETLSLGNTKIIRDWGWAPEYVVAMWQMLQMDSPDDYVIATGKSVTLEYFIKRVFDEFSLNWQDHVKIEKSLYRPTDLTTSYANAEKASKKLGWKAKYDINDVVKFMVAGSIKEHGIIS